MRRLRGMVTPGSGGRRRAEVDLAQYLAGERLETLARARLFRVVTGPHGPVFDLVANLSRAKDLPSLRLLRDEVTSLHEVLDAQSAEAATLPEDLGSPFQSGESTGSAGLRALASLGLCLAGDRDDEHDLTLALRWFDASRTTVGAAPGGIPDLAGRHGSARLTTLLRRLAETDEVTYGPGTAMAAAVALRELEAPLRPCRVTPGLRVLLDMGEKGRRYTLRFSLVRGQAPCLVADPRVMTLFAADERFQRALDRAWRTAGGEDRIAGMVKWSLDGDAGPPLRVEDESLGAAFAVLLDETRRLQRRSTGFATVNRIRPRTAVIGALGEHDALNQVGGYPAKLEAAGEDARVVVPQRDHALAAADTKGTVLLPAPTWKAAARLSRRRDRMTVARLTLAGGLVVALVAGFDAFLARGDRRTAELRETASRVAAVARWQMPGDIDGTALLLAMASDDIARKAGKPTEVLRTLAHGMNTLVKVVKPPRGAFRDVALTPDGRYALLSTDAGAARVVSTLDGTARWALDLPPGSAMARGQVHVSALAFSPDSKQAAVATSDRKIRLLRLTSSGWSAGRTLGLPVPTKRATGWELNQVEHMSFSFGGLTLDTYGTNVGLHRFRLDTSEPPQHCPAPERAFALFSRNDDVLLTRAGEVRSFVLDDCRSSRVLAAREGITLSDAAEIKGKVTAVGTLGKRLFVQRGDADLETVASEGPYRGGVFNRGTRDWNITAENLRYTFAWSADDLSRRFGVANSGQARYADSRLIWMSRDMATVHNGDIGGFAMVRGYRDPVDITHLKWAAKDLIVGRARAVYGIPAAARPGDGAQQLYKLALPPGHRLAQLATDRSGRWAAGAFSPDEETTAAGVGNRSMTIWDLSSRSTVPVDADPAESVNTVSFAGDRLYVGHRSGVLDRLRWTDGRWRRERRLQLPGSVLSVATDDRRPALVALLSRNRAKLSVVKIALPDLKPAATRELSGDPSAGRVIQLADGGIVAAHGPGIVDFLDADLRLRGVLTDGGLTYIRDLAEVPGTGEIVVAGRLRAATIDVASRVRVSPGWAHMKEVAIASPSRDGGVMAVHSSRTRTTTVWTMRPVDLRRRACAAIGRDLTRDEWLRYIGTSVDYDPPCRD